MSRHGYPDPLRVSRTIPDAWRVLAVSDIHGTVAGITGALRRAGVTDGEDRFVAGPGVALVVAGDHVNRGPDSLATVRLLARLREEAAAAGSRVVLLRGNHEEMVLDAASGDLPSAEVLLLMGGDRLIAELDPRADRRSARAAVAALQGAPGMLAILRSTLPYARHRDVLFIHAGPIPGARLADHEGDPAGLWDAGFLVGQGLGHPAYRALRAEGIERVVIGHLPGDGVRVLDRGRVLLIDADAPGLRRRDAPGASRAQALVAIPDGPRFVAGRLGGILVPTDT